MSKIVKIHISESATALLRSIDNPGPYYNYTPKFAELFRQVPPGGYWKDLPKELHREALGNAYDSGGGKTGFFRRLSWDSPAPTVTGKPNRKGSAMCHPEAVRSLSVKECGRIQGFPDNWIIAGSTDAQFRQIGNAVPVHLGEAIGRCLLSGELATDGELDPEVMLQNAIKRLRASGRNKASKKNRQKPELPYKHFLLRDLIGNHDGDDVLEVATSNLRGLREG